MIQQYLGKLRNFSAYAAKLTGAVMGLYVGGCAIHPLPEDFSGVTSRQIARQIRCETREAVIDSVLGYLTDPRNAGAHRVDERSRDLGNLYSEARKTDPSAIKKFKPAMLTGAAQKVVDLIWRTGIAYNYNLEMTETNNNDGSLNLINVFPRSNRSFGFGAKLDLERQNTRIFTITDTFGTLVNSVDPDYCRFGYQVERKDMIYPIAGKIGIDEVVHEFTVMALFDNLSGKVGDDPSGPKGPSQMAEQLQFTTTIDVSVAPKVTFTPIGRGLHVADASFTAQSIRKDLHKLTLGLYVPSGATLAALRGGILRDLGVSSLGALASAPVRTQGEEGALAIVNQALLLRLFQVRAQILQP
ncbi:hypothetical protein MKK67_00525 [Methylobacterium sp. J-072]|uniref:hypothetical protein n=1 Tax=Methylobacterium sp. J-072 TaxID=2836651 RepID=UPI001FBBF0DA|nr:hypothetical protein [Methylobacterium sp. J-072]MCJ2091000.1 hypothetical protein [Methylobacterium sp. J-072]